MKNTPYVKQYNELGQLLNPINGAYISPYPNHATRNARPDRFKSNKKGVCLTVGEHFTLKYHRHVQEIVLKNGKVKRIQHYLLKN